MSNISNPSTSTTTSSTKDPMKKNYMTIWVDGCFDMMHFGHANAIRQAKMLYPRVKLICGVHTDAEIQKHKGPTVMNEEERYSAVRACKWVDEVVEGAPYTTQVNVLREHGVDFCVHGEDISFDENGEDTYKAIKEAGLMKIVKRTEGVSSTDAISRMLKLAKHYNITGDNDTEEETIPSPTSPVDSPYTRARPFLPTTHKVWQFSNPIEPYDKDDSIPSFNQPIIDAFSTANKTVVYVDGAFDLFHTGHSDFLRDAKNMGDYLIVGIHDDDIVKYHKGQHYPIMNLHERVLSVLSCRYVDDVVIGAPFVVTKDLIDSLRINVVVNGSVKDGAYEIDPYQVAKELGIYKLVPSPRPDLTTTTIVKRIIANAKLYEQRNAKKQLKEVKNMEKFGHKIAEINKDVINN